MKHTRAVASIMQVGIFVFTLANIVINASKNPAFEPFPTVLWGFALVSVVGVVGSLLSPRRG